MPIWQTIPRQVACVLSLPKRLKVSSKEQYVTQKTSRFSGQFNVNFKRKWPEHDVIQLPIGEE